jgi:hypothetical protein
MSVVPANLAAELHPGPPTEYVAVALYGGPKDGMPIPVVRSKDIRGTCYVIGFAGTYELSGFYRAGNFDYAIYERKGVKK